MRSSTCCREAAITPPPAEPADAPSAGIYLGLISGSSVDGIDAALVRFRGDVPSSLAARTFAYPRALREAILSHSQRDTPLALDALGQLDQRIGAAFAEAAFELLQMAGVDPRAVVAVGSHGQTLRHRPTGDAPFSLQLGDAAVIAERIGTTVVADFRRRDVAAGGQGAPLMPAFHAAVLRSDAEDRAVLNLGGIANLTLLPRNRPVSGFDTGPANGLLDAWCLRHTGAGFDRNGDFAAAGRVDEVLLQRLLDEPWLGLPAPKSTGRDLFHLDWLQQRMGPMTLSPADVQATLLSLTARSVADALRRDLPTCRALIACGGGVHNSRLMHSLQAELPDVRLESSAAHGIDPDFVEAIGFAWLARETLAGRPGNLPEVTGARGGRILGAIHPGANWISAQLKGFKGVD